MSHSASPPRAAPAPIRQPRRPLTLPFDDRLRRASGRDLCRTRRGHAAPRTGRLAGGRGPDRTGRVHLRQIDLARTPPWEPFAVLCRWRKRDWVSGRPLRDTLPPVDGHGVEWHENAFERGLGWRLNVRSLLAWEKTEQVMLGRVPVGELHLWSAATLDDWRRCRFPVVPQLRKVHFVASPIGRLRASRHPGAWHQRHLSRTRQRPRDALCGGRPSASPLGQVVRGLHFHMGHEAPMT